MRFFGYGKSKIILKNKFNLMLSVFSNHLDTIDGIYSHYLEKIDFFVKNNSELKEEYISKKSRKIAFFIICTPMPYSNLYAIGSDRFKLMFHINYPLDGFMLYKLISL